LGIAVELPDRLAGRRLEGVQPTVAAGENHLSLAVDFGVGRAGPGPLHDPVAGRVVRPDHLAGPPVEGHEAWGLRMRHRLGRRACGCGAGWSMARADLPFPVTTNTRLLATRGEE